MPISTSLFPNEISVNWQALNADSPMEVTESGIVSVPLKRQLPKALLPIEVTELPSVSLPFSLVSFENAPDPIVFTLLGILKSPDRLSHPLKALLPIVSRLSGSKIDVNALQSLNAVFPISFKRLLNVMEGKPVQ